MIMLTILMIKPLLCVCYKKESKARESPLNFKAYNAKTCMRDDNSKRIEFL